MLYLDLISNSCPPASSHANPIIPVYTTPTDSVIVASDDGLPVAKRKP